MNPSTAELVLYGITAVSVLVWVEGLRFLTATIRRGRNNVEQFTLPEEQTPPNIVHGSAEVEGRAAELSQKAAALLAAKSMRICQRTDELIEFETPSEYLPGQTRALLTMQGQMRFTPLSDRTTRVDYALAVPRPRILLILGFVFQTLGFLAIVSGFAVIYFLVVPSPNPAVRWQTLQMIQVVHFLWPPFLFAGIYRKTASLIKGHFDTFICNLPFLVTPA